MFQKLNWKKNRHRDKVNISINEYDNILQTDLDEELIDKIEYVRIIKKLMYIMKSTLTYQSFIEREITKLYNWLIIRMRTMPLIRVIENRQ